MSPSEKSCEELAGRKLPEETKPVPDAKKYVFINLELSIYLEKTLLSI